MLHHSATDVRRWRNLRLARERSFDSGRNGAVQQFHDAVREAGVVGGVGDHDDGGARGVEVAEEVHDVETVVAVEVAGGLVAEDELRVGDDRAGHGDTLLLPAGELLRIVARPVDDAHALQHLVDFRLALRLAESEIAQRQLHVFENVHVVDKVEALEDETDDPTPKLQPVFLAQGGDLPPVEPVVARVGGIEESEDVEQGGLTATGRAHHGYEFALPDLQIYSL